MSVERPTPRFRELLQVLAAFGVEHVIIGGVAGRAHGGQQVTFDLDITPDPHPDNLKRLARALVDLQARIRTGEGEEIDAPIDAAMIGRFSTLALRTELGDLDVVLRPDGIADYARLREAALTDESLGLQVLIASRDDIVRSRREAARITGDDRYRQLADALEALGSRRRTL